MGALPRDPGRKARREQLEAQAWRVLCPACGAQPGEPCRTEAGDGRKAHPVRIRLSTYIQADFPAVTACAWCRREVLNGTDCCSGLCVRRRAMFLALSGLPVEHPYPEAVSAAWGRLEALCEPHQAST